jgi:nicotinamide-nucleotide amidase
VIDELAARVAEQLKKHGVMLATAESCTGGWAAQAMTAIAGSSDWFERGFVTYSNDAKCDLLGVNPSTLQKSGAVSEETAREMARGALQNSKAGVALAVTGIAGPTGGSDSKPVGTVCFGWATKKGAVRSETRRFPGDREAVRRQSVIHALEGVLKVLDAG